MEIEGGKKLGICTNEESTYEVMRRMMRVGARRDRDRKMGSKQQKERGGAQRGEEEGRGG